MLICCSFLAYDGHLLWLLLHRMLRSVWLVHLRWKNRRLIHVLNVLVHVVHVPDRHVEVGHYGNCLVRFSAVPTTTTMGLDYSDSLRVCFREGGDPCVSTHIAPVLGWLGRWLRESLIEFHTATDLRASSVTWQNAHKSVAILYSTTISILEMHK